MPKAEPLTSAALAVSQARSQDVSALPASPPVQMMPLQLRLPRAEVRAIKIAAAEREQTLSGFMLACFHAYIKDEKHA
jgi:hypothetical protein